MNQKFCEITGYSKEELLHLKVSDITHPDDMEENKKKRYSKVKGIKVSK